MIRTKLYVVTAALAFLALLAPSAMAETGTLCEEDTTASGCEAAEASHVHFTTGEEPVKLLSTVNVKCDGLFLGEVLESGAPLIIHGNYTYTNCETFSGGECKSVTEVSTNSLFEVLKTGSELAEVADVSKVLVYCVGIHCVYNGTGLKAVAEGSLKSGHLTIEEQALNKVSGLLCPKTATLDLLLESLTELFIRSSDENTVLCEEDTTASGCEAAEASHVHFTTLSEEPAKLLSNTVNVRCDTLFLGEALELGAPLIIHGNYTYTNCETFSGGECKSVAEVSTDSLLEVLKTGSEVAEVADTGEVLVECVSIHCVFKGTGLKAVAEGSLKSGHLTIEEQALNKVSGLLCPKTATLDLLLESLTEFFIRE